MGLSFVSEANFQSCDNLTFLLKVGSPRQARTTSSTKWFYTSTSLQPLISITYSVGKIRAWIYTFTLVPTGACHAHSRSKGEKMLQINACRIQSDERRYRSFEILDWWLVCIYLCSTSRMHRSILSCCHSMSRESTVKQLLADVDEHDVGVYSAVGR